MKKWIFGMVGAVSIMILGNLAVYADTQETHFPQVHSGKYQIDPHHTQVVFSVKHFGFTYYSGTLSQISGHLSLNPAQLSKSKVNIKIPMQSVQTTSPVLDGELKGQEWFDATHYPTADFTSTKIVKTGNNTADVTGNLTLHGVTKLLTLHVSYIGSGVNPLDKKYTVGFQMNGVIHRSEFGVTKYVPAVSDDVKLEIAGAFEQE